MSQDMESFKAALRQLDQTQLLEHMRAAAEVASEKDIWTTVMALEPTGYIQSALYILVDPKDLTGMIGMLANYLFFQSRIAADIIQQTGISESELKQMAFDQLLHLRKTSDSTVRSEHINKPKPPEDPFNLPRR